jgi:hypothetical protein
MKPTLFIALCALVLGGCATEVGQYTFIKGRHPAKPVDSPIEVFTNGVPSRPFERIAYLDAHCESQFWADPNVQIDAIPELKKQARLSGCDAIIEIESRKPTNWTLETRTIHVTATGISYK